MTDLGIVFLTGLTTGGLSCLALQGGLLAGSVAQQAEHDLYPQGAAHQARTTGTPAGTPRRAGQRSQPVAAELSQQRFVWPIVLFLGAKLLAYSLLGFLLGALGAVLHLTPVMRAILQLTIGIFLVGTALRMFNVHPVFRWFVVVPPSGLTRYIRRRAQQPARTRVTPLVLGALTVFIPCGVTQTMMAVAVGTGNPWLGAATMGAFTLGTSPVFFGLAYLATRLSAVMEARVAHVTALVVLLFGLGAVDAGLTLVGSPVSFARVRAALRGWGEQAPRGNHGGPAGAASRLAPMRAATAQPVVTIRVLDWSYEPGVVWAPAGQPVQLRLVTKATRGCTRAFVIPALNVERLLPVTGTTVIELPAHAAGTLPFTCSMGMVSGAIEFE